MQSLSVLFRSWASMESNSWSSGFLAARRQQDNLRACLLANHQYVITSSCTARGEWVDRQ
jgi:hypothetical protein